MKNIVLVGFMATGKSTVGRQLAARLNRQVVDTDDLIEAKAGKSISKIFAEDGEARFRDMESQVAREVSRLSGYVIITGGGIVLRDENMEALKKAGPVFCLTASPEAVYDRTRGTSHRPLLEGDDPLGRIRNLLALREPFYGKADYIIDTSALSIAEVEDRVVQVLHEHHPDLSTETS